MSKSKPFTIYLLKKNYNADNALKEGHRLVIERAERLPDNSVLYLQIINANQPWWRDFFGISKNILQASASGLVFLPINDRYFVLSFGRAYHNLKDECYEYDFGLLVTLNCIDPEKLKSTDVLEPSEARRKMIQPASPSELTHFDFDSDSNILKRLTGSVKKEYEALFKQVTGSSSVHVQSKVSPTELPTLCRELLSLYTNDGYLNTFPGIRNVETVRDPQVIHQLDQKLVEAFREKNDETLALTVPAIINYEEDIYSSFNLGKGTKYLYEDVYIKNYYTQLESNNITLKDFDISLFHHHQLIMTDENGATRDAYNIFKCLVFETSLSDKTECYHLCDGSWYKVEKNYLKELHNFLDDYYEEQNLPEYNHSREGEYNIAAANNNNNLICLDTLDIRPLGESAIEPCDLYTVSNNTAVLLHVKVSTLSNKLSHLFNQGTNTIQLLKLEPASKEKIKKLIKSKLGNNNETSYIQPIDNNKYKVVFAIVTRKEKSNKSKNLPLFSRISLKRSINALRVMDVKVSFCFIKNLVKTNPPKIKPKKSKIG